MDIPNKRQDSRAVVLDILVSILMLKRIVRRPVFEGEEMGRKISLNYEWEFQKNKITDGIVPEMYENGGFSEVVLPHDWLIGQENLYEDSVGWYRRKLWVEKKEKECYYLRFEGVYMNTTVYVNGVPAGEWMYGYTTFEVDMTKYIRDGENEILVKVIHQAPNSRWYTGAGIYRPVWFVVREETHFEPDGIYIHTRKENNGYHTEISAEIVTEQCAECEIRYTIYDERQQKVGQKTIFAGALCADLFADNVKEWSVQSPTLYTLRAELIIDDTVVDTEEITFGYRTMELTSDKGFFLNGEHLKIKGVCLHHDLGCLGTAVNKGAIRRQLMLMKEMGANAVRTAHNMPSVEFMELCDEMGILVVSEAFDCWKKPKTPYDYARFF